MKVEFNTAQTDEIHVSERDGAYFFKRRDVIQVIVVGPMNFTPMEYEIAVREKTGYLWELSSAEFMSLSAENKKIGLRRGFVSLIFDRPE
jgi:hypothetical protein